MSSPRLGRPPLVSRAGIVEAVLDVGFEQATMAAVAAHLGVDSSTLYRHVDSRTDMLDAAADLALRRAEWPVPPGGAGGWRPFLTTYAEGIWSLCERHPGLAVYLRSAQTVPPELVRHTLIVVAYLREALGFSVLDAAVIVDTVGDLTIDAFLIARQLAEQPASVAGLARRYTELAEEIARTDPAAALLAGEYLQVVTDAVAGVGGREQWWRRKLAYVLDGIETRIGR